VNVGSCRSGKGFSGTEVVATTCGRVTFVVWRMLRQPTLLVRKRKMLLAPRLPRALFFKHQKNSNFKVSIKK
jgi:hypothetical protein